MSTEKSDLVRKLAEELYSVFASKVGHSHWDWNPVATTAIQAATAFQAIFEAASQPQTSVPPADATSSDASPDPKDQGDETTQKIPVSDLSSGSVSAPSSSPPTQPSIPDPSAPSPKAPTDAEPASQ